MKFESEIMIFNKMRKAWSSVFTVAPPAGTTKIPFFSLKKPAGGATVYTTPGGPQKELRGPLVDKHGLNCHVSTTVKICVCFLFINICWTNARSGI